MLPWTATCLACVPALRPCGAQSLFLRPPLWIPVALFPAGTPRRPSSAVCPSLDVGHLQMRSHSPAFHWEEDG